MPTINVEIMQKLLQEFTEKEALTGEEIKAIEQQVLELENRITVCRDRLQNLNEDKDRLAAMMSRYVGAGSLPALKGGSDKAKAIPKLADRPQPPVERNMPTSTPETMPNAPAKNSVIEDLEPAAQGNASPTEMDSQDAAASGDDAIKSINDALKGLFRK